MLTLRGPAAETAFRLEKLTAEIGAIAPDVRRVAARFEHYVHVERPLSADEMSVLEALLDYGARAEPDRGGQALHVVPRLGTISPWSSKATDIARICGLPVTRIERGT